MSQVRLCCQSCKTTNTIPTTLFDNRHSCIKCKNAITDGSVMEVLPHNFNRILKSRLPLVMYFWGPNCNNCKAFIPIIDQVAKQSSGRYRFASVYVPKNSALANKYRIRGVPSFVLLKNGKQQAFVNGGMRKKELLDFIKNSL